MTISAIQPHVFDPVTGKGWNSFAVIGDAGTGSKTQYKVAEQMYKTYQEKPFKKVLTLGDNVYFYGEPSSFDETIYLPYKQLFDAGIKFYPVLGNHDVRRGYRKEQLEYWGVPAYYTFQINEIDFFAIDTTLYLPDSYDNYMFNPEWALKKGENQTTWLEKALSESKRYKIVYGHNPLYTSGTHSVDTHELNTLRRILEPLFERYSVALYLAGHDHQYERTAPINGVSYFVVGSSGGKEGTIVATRPPYPRITYSLKPLFILFEITSDKLLFTAITKKGDIVDQGTIELN